MPEEGLIDSNEREGPAVEWQGTIGSSAEKHRSASQGAMDSAGAAVIDFKRAARLDSDALQVLLALDFALKRSGREPSTRGLNDDIRAYLGLTGASGPPANGDESPSGS